MIGLVRDRLLANALALTGVEIVETIEAIARGTSPASGTCFVAPWREVASANALASGGHRQLVTVELLTAILVRQDDDIRGAARAERFEALRTSVETALAGWQPAEDTVPFELVGSQSGSISPLNASVWIQTWETSRYLTGA